MREVKEQGEMIDFVRNSIWRERSDEGQKGAQPDSLRPDGLSARSRRGLVSVNACEREEIGGF